MTLSTVPIFRMTTFLGSKVHVIDAEEYTVELNSYIDEYFVEICEGDSGSSIQTVKRYILDLIEETTDNRRRMGVIAEFFIHLYLKNLGFEQLFTFLNLEERSLKKGFDGHYKKDDKTWIMESKSGSINTAGLNHPYRIKYAYDDLAKKFRGEVKNNPWRNALNHARVVGASGSIKENIRKLSEDFANKNYTRIEEYNVIPVSTIFHEGNWEEMNLEDFKTEMRSKIKLLKCTNVFVICINKKSLELFIDYLNL